MEMRVSFAVSSLGFCVWCGSTSIWSNITQKERERDYRVQLKWLPQIFCVTITRVEPNKHQILYFILFFWLYPCMVLLIIISFLSGFLFSHCLILQFTSRNWQEQLVFRYCIINFHYCFPVAVVNIKLILLFNSS